METFSKDIELLLDNAAKYYKLDSQEYKDALTLKDVFLEAKDRLCSEEEEGRQWKVECRHEIIKRPSYLNYKKM